MKIDLLFDLIAGALKSKVITGKMGKYTIKITEII